MNIPRAFLLVGSLYLVLGIGLGIYMGASGDHSLSPVHAHINLLGFAVMAIFGLVYRAYPAMAAQGLVTVHFWLHLLGGGVLLVMLFLMMSGNISEAAMFPLAPIAEAAVMVGLLCFVFNLWRNGR